MGLSGEWIELNLQPSTNTDRYFLPGRDMDIHTLFVFRQVYPPGNTTSMGFVSVKVAQQLSPSRIGLTWLDG